MVMQLRLLNDSGLGFGGGSGSGFGGVSGKLLTPRCSRRQRLRHRRRVLVVETQLVGLPGG